MLEPNFLGELGQGSGQSILKSFRLCFNGVTRFLSSRMGAVILDPVLSYSSFVGKDLIAVRSLAEACLDCFCCRTNRSITSASSQVRKLILVGP